MKRVSMFVRVAAVALASIAISGAAKANIIYNLDNYSSLQDGYTVQGTITTDGATGVLGQTDIVAFDFTVSNGVYSYDYYNPHLTADDYNYAVVVAHDLTATANTLSITPGGHSDLVISPGSSATTLPTAQFYWVYSVNPNIIQYAAFVEYPPVGQSNTLFDHQSADAGDLSNVAAWADAGFEVARVPEPATFSLLASALLGLGAFLLAR